MKKQRIYLDTSVFGGLFDEEFKEVTEFLFERIKNAEFEVIFSNITEQELENAPEKVKMATQLLLESSTEYINSDIETVELAKKYIEEGVVGAYCTLLFL